ncbi:MAG TPA: TIGR00289 family protein, partial [Candidatus Bathyarchaeia archaeon]|nr:TIGR00289 family protein [Candidatus Bathyarchaeia archaeon]
MTLRVAVSFSGGKDSTYATWISMHQGWDVSLVTVRPHSVDSLMFHHPNVEWTHLQAQSMRLSHEAVEMTHEDEMTDLQQALAKMKSRNEISGLVTGAVASDYQKTRFDNMCDAVGLKSYAPLWHKSPKLLVEDLKKSGFR